MRKKGGQEGGKRGLGPWRSRFVVSFNFAVVFDFDLSSVLYDARETREKIREIKFKNYVYSRRQKLAHFHFFPEQVLLNILYEQNLKHVNKKKSIL
jgi:hypothetical protein